MIVVKRHLHEPLRVSRPAGDGFEQGDPLKAEVEQINQSHTERSEEVEGFTDKVATCRRKQLRSTWMLVTPTDAAVSTAAAQTWTGCSHTPVLTVESAVRN